MQNVWENGKKFEAALTADDLPGGVSLASLGLRYFTPREVSKCLFILFLFSFF